jgi:hypothetical protein
MHAWKLAAAALVALDVALLVVAPVVPAGVFAVDFDPHPAAARATTAAPATILVFVVVCTTSPSDR